MRLLASARSLVRRAGIDVAPWPHRPEDGVIDWALTEVISSPGINCVIDVRGNQGQLVRRVRALGYSGRVVSFEPSPTVIPIISAAAERYPNWVVRPVALSRSAEEAELRLHELSELNSLLDALPNGTHP